MAGYQKNEDGKVVIQIDTSAKVDLSAYEKLNNLIELPQQKILPEFSPHLLLPSDISLMPLPPKQTIQKTQPNINIYNFNNISCSNDLITYIAKLPIPQSAKDYIFERLDAFYGEENIFTDNELELLQALRDNPAFSNKELAKQMNYSDSYTQDLCKSIREKMGFDAIEDDKIKRQLLVLFAIS